MQTTTTEQINTLYGKISEDALNKLTATLPGAKESTLKELPLWLLESMKRVALQTNNKESLSIIEREIKLNLEAQDKAYEAKQWAKECEDFGKELDKFESYIKAKYTIKND